MDDAYRFWHQAMVDYFDPDAFRGAFNACIQAMRTVTWVLQGLKNDIPGLDAWYTPWQERMRGDIVLRWVVEARNKIEHKGDISAKSVVTASIIASYYENEVIHADVAACIMDTVGQIFSKIPVSILEDQIIAHGALRLERRWVDDQLPNYEVLDALRYAYGELQKIIDDAHVLLLGKICHRPKREADDRINAMAQAGEDTRKALFSLKTGEQFSLKMRSRDVIDPNRVLKRYGATTFNDFADWPTSLEEVTERLFVVARKLFEKDGHHISIAIIMKSLAPVKYVQIDVPDRMTKYLVMRMLASEVERIGASEVAIISEVWIAQFNPERPFEYPSDRSDRKEALTIIACSSKGEKYQRSAEIIRRRFRKPKLGQTEKVEMTQLSSFSPIFDVWGIKCE